MVNLIEMDLAELMSLKNAVDEKIKERREDIKQKQVLYLHEMIEQIQNDEIEVLSIEIKDDLINPGTRFCRPIRSGITKHIIVSKKL